MFRHRTGAALVVAVAQQRAARFTKSTTSSSSSSSSSTPRTAASSPTSAFSPMRSFDVTSSTAHRQSKILAAATDNDNNSVRQSYKEAVEQRVVGNAALRKLIKTLPSAQYTHAVEAVEGAKEGGLIVDADTCEVFLALLLDAGQLRQAMETYQYMLRQRVCPNTRSYNQLMELCLSKQSWTAALSLFGEMQRRGRQPDVESYENALTALSLASPPNWEKAVEIFDKLQRNKNALSSHTYNALMKVYLAMEPYDWRVVYNAYLEMRGQKPHIQFGWDSYALVKEAMIKGNAGRVRRCMTFIDAWIQITPPLSVAYMKGMITFLICLYGVRWFILWCGMQVRDAIVEARGVPSESSLET